MSSRHLSNDILLWTKDGLDRWAPRENATYEVTIAIDPQHGPLALVLLWMPSIVIGEQMQVVGALPNPATITREQVLEFVREGVEAMRAERSQQATSGPQGGQGTLLVPGRG